MCVSICVKQPLHECPCFSQVQFQISAKPRVLWRSSHQSNINALKGQVKCHHVCENDDNDDDVQHDDNVIM